MIGNDLDKTFTKISISEAEALARKANAAKMAKMAKKKHFVTQEMIDTEKKYVDSLKRIVGNYYRPLMSACGTDRQILDRNEIKTIFSNMEQLLLLNVELRGSGEGGSGRRYRRCVYENRSFSQDVSCVSGSS